MQRFAAPVLVIALMMSTGDLGAQEGTPETVVLSLQGNWRAFYVLAGPFIRDGDKLEQRGTEVETPPPPVADPERGRGANWRDADFDDHTWHRLQGMPFPPNPYGRVCAEANAGFAYIESSSAFQSLICLRGRFTVTDPAQVKDLVVSVEYRGGVAVWLNGREIVRANLPAGELKPDTLAEDYPLDAFLDPDGKPQKEDWRTKDVEMIARWKRIKRRLVDVKVPVQFLRKGVNVLAVEVHRAAYPKGYDEEISKISGYGARPHLRSTCGVTDVTLKSSDGRGLVANVLRPDGVQVWNSSVLVDDPHDFGDPLEPLRALTIPACRNGTFSGEVSVGSRAAITKLAAAASNLVEARTKAVLPSSCVLIRFDGSETPPAEIQPVARGGFRSYEYADAPAELPGASQPVTVSVKVPADAEPGDYAGTLTLTAEGAEAFVVPLVVRVSPFTLPEPKDWETVVDLIQSPDTLAMQYNVAFWSDAHWKLIERSFEVLGRAGLDTAYIPMMAETHFGNEQSMVRWVKKPDPSTPLGAGGKYDYDFSILERYLDAYEKHCGKPRFVCLYAWDISLEGGADWVNRTMGKMTDDVIREREEHAKLALGPAVTSVDPATGQVERLQLPQYSEQGSLELHRPLYEKLREVLKKRGILDRAVLGIPLDPKPTKEVVNLFARLMPDASWVVQDHIYSQGEKIHGARVAYQANVFLHGLGTRDVQKSRYGTVWPEPRLRFPRGLSASNPPHALRLFPEMQTLMGLQGFARVGGDLWPVMADKRGRKHALPNRYPKANAGGLSVWTCQLAPGPDGARETPGFRMLCEGLQETQARILIERALIDGKITGELAERARDLLTRRNLATLVGLEGRINDHHHTQWWEHTAGFYAGTRTGTLWYLASDHDGRTRQLFDLAAEVAVKLSKR